MDFSLSLADKDRIRYYTYPNPLGARIGGFRKSMLQMDLSPSAHPILCSLSIIYLSHSISINSNYFLKTSDINLGH